MIVFLNGRFVPEGQATVSVFDRGFLYGDGVFETMRVFNGRPFRWERHMERLERGLAYLKIAMPCSSEELRENAARLVVENKMPNSLLRITISRGRGVRGYSPAGANSPTLVMTLHHAPEIPASEPPAWKLITSTIRLPAGEPLAAFKTSSKIPQILARAEADAAGADDALLLNTDGYVVEGSGSNLFWVEDGCVCTPPLPSGILPGVTRIVVLEICSKLGIKTREANVGLKHLAMADAIFLTVSSFGIVECASLDGREFRRSEAARRLFVAYGELLKKETANGYE